MRERSIPDAMQAATANGTYYVTRRQLWNAWARPTKGLALIGFLAFGAPIGFYIAGAAHWGPMGPVLIGTTLFLLCLWAWSLPFPDQDSFDRVLRTYLRRFPAPDRLILKPRLQHAPPPAEADVHDHGVAAILLVDEDTLVDFLVLNGVHASLGVAVISASGYPEYIQAPLRRLPPTTPLYVLHTSATPYASLVDAARRLFPDRVNPPDLDLGIVSSARWFPKRGIRRDTLKAPDLLNAAFLIRLLRTAITNRVTFRSAVSVIAREDRRSSSHGDSHGWG